MVPRKQMRAEMFLTDRWVDVSDDVRYSRGFTISQGSASQDRTVPPSALSAALDNRSENYSRRNPLSANYGKLGTNTPFRLSAGITADAFARSVSGGWGSSNFGDSWSSFQSSGTTADFAVSAGIATHTIATASNSRGSYMAAQTHRNVRVSVECSLTFTNVTGANLEPANLILRGLTTSSYLMLRVVITTAEAFTLELRDSSGVLYGSGPVTVPGVTHAADQWFKVVLEAEGGTARAKLWIVNSTVDGSDGEPLNWHLEAAIPAPARGFVGVRSGVASGNTNVPVTFRYRNFEVRSSRFIGESAVMSPKWDLSEKDRYVNLDVAGILRRLGQGSPVLKSTLRRGIPTLPNLIQYWPMEDGSDSGSLASAIEGAPEMTIDADYDLAAYSGFASSEAVPTLGAAIFRGSVPSYTSTGAVQTRWIMHMPDVVYPDDTHIHRVWLSGGTMDYFDVRAGAGAGSMKIVGISGGVEVLNSTVGFDLRDINCRFSLELRQVGSDIEYGMWAYEVGAGAAGGATGTLAGEELGIASRVDFSLLGDLQGMAIGHATVETAVTSVFDLSSQLNAYNGETATARMGRLCFEEGVQLTITGEFDTDALMGPQLPDTLLNLLKQCADVEQGILHESRSRLALRYRTRLSMINQSAAVTIDRSLGQLSDPFDPKDDDRLTLNDVTARRFNGSSFRAQQFTGPLSVADPPSGAGRVDAAPEFNAYWDIQLPHLASWLLALGTVDDYRYPAVAADMAAPGVAKDQQLVYDLLSLEVGDLLVLKGLAPLGIFDDVRQICRGYNEAMFSHRHKITANTFPAQPYSALILDDATLGRMDSDSSSLASGFSETAMSFSVATTDPQDLWTTDAAEFPLDVMIGGERIRISAIAGAASPQTFTVAASGRGINGVRPVGATTGGKAHVAGEAVHIFDVVRLA